jgi:hypothetical protein
MKFLKDLSGLVNYAIARAEEYKKMNSEKLIRRERQDAWNALECLEHLNRYGDFYLPEIEKSIHSSDSKPAAQFKSGWLGGILAKSMEPKEKVNKVKTFKSKNPLHSHLDVSVIDVFLEQQYKTMELLKAVERVNINSVRVKTSISPLLRLRLGDTLQFMINHVLRHVKQADNALLNTQETVRN